MSRTIETTPEQLQEMLAMARPMRDLCLGCVSRLMQQGMDRSVAYNLVGSIALGIACGTLLTGERRCKPSQEWNAQVTDYIDQMVALVPMERP